MAWLLTVVSSLTSELAMARPPLSLAYESQLALVLGGALAALAYIATRRLGRSTREPSAARDPPTLPSTLPIVGNLFDLIRHADVMHGWTQEGCAHFDYEPWKAIIPGSTDFVVLSSPEAIEEVTITQLDAFPKGEFMMDTVRDMFGAGMITSDGERWFHQRKVGAKFFSSKVMRQLIHDSVYKNLERVCGVLDRCIAEDTQLDLMKLFLEFTIETFAHTGMGVELNCIGAEEPHRFQKGLDASAPVVMRRARLPPWYWKLERWLCVGHERSLATNMGNVRTWLNEVIHKSLEEGMRKKKAGTQHRDDEIKSVVQMFVEYSSQDELDDVDPQDLLDFMLTFVIAARDTTANTLGWFMLLMRDHPLVVENIRKELRGVVGTDQVQWLTTDHTKQLVYLEAVIKETLRLYPGAPITLRQAIRDTIICGNVKIHKGDSIGLFAPGLARNPKVWGPDAAEFKPERWINPDNHHELLQFPATKFFSFSAGPRSCIGMNVAMMQLRTMTANLLYRYEFDIDKANDGSYVVAPTYNMKYPLLAKVRKL